MNKGIQRATGDIVGILNSDDRYDLHTVAKVVSIFSAEDCDIVHGDAVLVDSDGKELLVQPPGAMGDHLYLGMTLQHPTVFVRRHIYEVHGAFCTAYRLAADYDLMLRLQEQGCKFRYLPERLAYFYIGGASGMKRWRCLHETQCIALRHFGSQSGRLPMLLKKRMQTRFLQRRLEVMRRYLTERAQRRLGSIATLNAVRRFLPDGGAFAIFGAGLDGLRCYVCLQVIGLPICCFLDNAVVKQQQRILGKRVLSPEVYRNELKNAMILIASSDYQAELVEQLESMGMRRFVDYLLRSDLQEALFRAAYGVNCLQCFWELHGSEQVGIER